jgi:site-specific DNA-adenine methylase
MNDSGTHSVRVSRRMPMGQHIIWLLTSASLAWYAWSNHKLLKQYRIVRDNFHMTDEEMADFGKHRQEYLDAMKRQDEMAAAIALGALVKLDSGDLEKAKSRLQTAISIYYRGHRDDGDSNVLRHITTFAATNAALSNAIYRKLE